MHMKWHTKDEAKKSLKLRKQFSKMCLQTFDRSGSKACNVHNDGAQPAEVGLLNVRNFLKPPFNGNNKQYLVACFVS